MPGQIRYLDTSPDEDNGLPGSPDSKSGDCSDSALPDTHQGVFAVLAQNFSKVVIDSSETKTHDPTQKGNEFRESEMVKDGNEAHDSGNVDDTFALFGQDRGVEVVNLDPDSDSEGADVDSRSTDSESSAASQSVADIAKKVMINKARNHFSGHLSSIDRDLSTGDSSDESDRRHILSNYGLGTFSMSCPSSGIRKSTLGKPPKSLSRHQVLTPEEKRRKREQALKRREELQLSVCTFRSKLVLRAFEGFED